MNHPRKVKRPARAGLLAPLTVLAIAVLTIASFIAKPTSTSAQPSPRGTLPSPEVSAMITLPSTDVHPIHPRQLVYDRQRNGLWFWTSTLEAGDSGDNRVYFYDTANRQLNSWPIYSGDWSSELLAGMALAPNGDVWIGWNHNLVDFHPSDHTSVRYALPKESRFPLPSDVTGDLPTDLGIADLAIGRDGNVWIARFAALSLTMFSPGTKAFSEFSLPSAAGDPAKLALGPDGHVFFTTNFAADHPGYIAERVCEFNPAAHATYVFRQPARSLTVTANGDLYTSIQGGYGLAFLPAADRVHAEKSGQAPSFRENITSFPVSDTSLSTDSRGRVWVAVANNPDLAVYDPVAHSVHRYQYAAPAVTGQIRLNSAKDRGRTVITSPPGAVWVSRIAGMATDSQGHLWYVREGSNIIEQVAA